MSEEKNGYEVEMLVSGNVRVNVTAQTLEEAIREAKGTWAPGEVIFDWVEITKVERV